MLHALWLPEITIRQTHLVAPPEPAPAVIPLHFPPKTLRIRTRAPPGRIMSAALPARLPRRKATARIAVWRIFSGA